MRALLHRFLRGFIRHGQLSVRYPDGQLVSYRGDDGPETGLEFRSNHAVRRMLTDPALNLGTSYMDGDLIPLGGTIYDVLELLMMNVEDGGAHLGARLHSTARGLLRRWAQFNPASRSRRNVAHHYDLGDQLYELFLDQDWQYSCAYFPTGTETLEEAQIAKKRHVASKLLLDRPGLKVLDIGCGWGGMALTLAQEYGADVTGITLSSEQLARARQRADQAGLADQVRFQLLDYRDPALGGPFDRIVSVGMFEHVGINHYDAFFRRIHALLAQDGVALVHAIGRADGPGHTAPWIARYIFPGGYSPALSEVLPAVERSNLITTDIEILRLHYAETIRHWRRRFAAHREEAVALYDERFCRMWEFYLAGSELVFRLGGHMNWQLQIANQLRAVPLTRDYMRRAELASAGQVAAIREDAD